jgi:hypothetical protein
MRKIMFLTLSMGLLMTASAQEKKVSLSKGKVMVDDTPICIIEKKKKSTFTPASFQLKSLDEKPIGFLQYNALQSPISGQLAWYKLTFDGIEDSVQFMEKDIEQFSKAVFIQYDGVLAKIIANYNLVKDNAVDKEAFQKLKQDFTNDYSKINSEKFEKETYCMKALQSPATSDPAAEATVVFVSSTDVTKHTTVLKYDVMQNGKKIGSIEATGSPKGAKEEDAEYDYSPGMLDLDGASPLNYEFTNAEGCIIARYIGEQKAIGTWKDRVTLKSGDIKKYKKDGVSSRLHYMQAMVNYLVAKRYL